MLNREALQRIASEAQQDRGARWLRSRCYRGVQKWARQYGMNLGMDTSDLAQSAFLSVLQTIREAPEKYVKEGTLAWLCGKRAQAAVIEHTRKRGIEREGRPSVELQQSFAHICWPVAPPACHRTCPSIYPDSIADVSALASLAEALTDGDEEVPRWVIDLAGDLWRFLVILADCQAYGAGVKEAAVILGISERTAFRNVGKLRQRFALFAPDVTGHGPDSLVQAIREEVMRD